MDCVERKREIKEDLEGLKEDLFSVENDELIKIYEKEILLKSLELEEIKLRIMLVCYN
tara:strand:- start:102 stop:275 length:174 start_codon:yes stop_codon:yes gene_type:complete